MELEQVETACKTCGGAIRVGDVYVQEGRAKIHYACSTSALRTEAAQAQQERDKVREVNQRLKVSTAKLLIAADKRVMLLRDEVAALSDAEPGIQWKTATVTPDELADLEMAGWKPQRIEFSEDGVEWLKVALRRIIEPKAARLPDPAESDAARETRPLRVLPLPPDTLDEAPTQSPDESEQKADASLPVAHNARVLALLTALAEGRKVRDVKAARAALSAGLVQYGKRRRIDHLRLTAVGRDLLAAGQKCEAA